MNICSALNSQLLPIHFVSRLTGKISILNICCQFHIARTVGHLELFPASSTKHTTTPGTGLVIELIAATISFGKSCEETSEQVLP